MTKTGTQTLLPSTNGRNKNGQFVAGYKGGPGNPYIEAVAKWRKAVVETVTPEDVTAVFLELVKAAKKGEPWAIHELLDRTLGRASQTVELTQNTELVVTFQYAKKPIGGEVVADAEFTEKPDGQHR